MIQWTNSNAQNSANAGKTCPISSAITETIVTYVQMSVKWFFSACICPKSKSVYNKRWYAVVRDLAILWFSGLWRIPVVLFGIAAWLVLICIDNFYLIIDWLIVALYIHCELLKSTYLCNINK